MPTVNALRVLLFVVLAITLPARGVMAAAVLCAPTLGAGIAHAAHPAPDTGGHVEAADHETMDCHPLNDTSGADTCNLCAACCSIPPLPCTSPKLAMPSMAGGAGFPALSVPRLHFLSNGQERPPRRA